MIDEELLRTLSQGEGPTEPIRPLAEITARTRVLRRRRRALTGAGAGAGLLCAVAVAVAIVRTAPAEPTLRTPATASASAPAATAAPATRRLSPSGWRASASSSYQGDVAAHLIDGDLATRWTSGRAMTKGAWVRLDLGTARTLTRVTMDAGDSTGDYPRGYQVLVSNDGLNWGPAVATGTGAGPVVTASFPARTVRWLKIVQTGTAADWWSIAELSLYGDQPTSSLAERTRLSPADWLASASSSYLGDLPAHLIDGDPATRWTSGRPMTDGAWVRLDLGAERTVSRVTMDSAASTRDYARGYRVFVSDDGRTWGSAVATGVGAGPVVTASFPRRSARWLKIVQTGKAADWWSIAELSLAP